jgi:hypothetical protein
VTCLFSFLIVICVARVMAHKNNKRIKIIFLDMGCRMCMSISGLD